MSSYELINGASISYNYLKSLYSKNFDMSDNLEILEIGNFCLDHTLVLQNNFPNSNITTYDNMGDVINGDKNFIDIWKKNYSKLNKNVEIILGTFQYSHNLKEFYHLIIIDVGRNSDNIIEILLKIKKFSHIFLLLPMSSTDRIKHRNRVIKFLNKKKYTYKIINSPWIHIYE